MVLSWFSELSSEFDLSQARDRDDHRRRIAHDLFKSMKDYGHHQITCLQTPDFKPLNEFTLAVIQDISSEYAVQTPGLRSVGNISNTRHTVHK